MTSIMGEWRGWAGGVGGGKPGTLLRLSDADCTEDWYRVLIVSAV